MTDVWQRVDEATAAVQSQVGELDLAAILGSGLGAFAEQLDEPEVIPYDAIPHFARSTVAGHAGELRVGELGGKRIGVFAGRFHYYEGYPIDQVVLPARLAAGLGAKCLVVTNAAGSVDPQMPPGSLMLLRDHINNIGANPLRGPNDPRGPRFPPLNDAYPLWLRDHARASASKLGVQLFEGVYMANAGPTYESPAEIKAMRTMGADAVGMSTVPEVIAAVHLGLPVLGISCITNFGAGLVDTPPSHEEVIEAGREVAGTFVELLRDVITTLPMDRLGD